MKKTILIALISFFGIQAQAQAQDQAKANSTGGKYDIEVKGNCGTCKKRIEKAAYSVSGVRTAQWHEGDQILHVMLNEKKATPEDVQNAVANVGHDTKFNGKEILAKDEVYQNLHECCLYERE